MASSARRKDKDGIGHTEESKFEDPEEGFGVSANNYVECCPGTDYIYPTQGGRTLRACQRTQRRTEATEGESVE